MKDEILLECLQCKENYIGTRTTDGYNCPRCGGRIMVLVDIEGFERSKKEMEKKIRYARWNGNIRDATKRVKHSKKDKGLIPLKNRDLTI